MGLYLLVLLALQEISKNAPSASTGDAKGGVTYKQKVILCDFVEGVAVAATRSADLWRVNTS